MSWLILSRTVNAETADWIERVPDPAVLSRSWIDEVNGLITDLKSSSIWTPITHLNIFAGAGSMTAASVPLKHPSNANASLVNYEASTDYKALGIDCGVQDYVKLLGGASKEITIPTGNLQSNAAYLLWGSSYSNALAVGAGSFPRFYQDTIGARMFAYSFSGSDDVSVSGAKIAGDLLAVRESSTSLKGYVNGTLRVTKTASSSTTPSLGSFKIGGNNTSSRATAFCVANGVTASQALQIRTRVQTTLQNIGLMSGVTSIICTGDSLTAGYGGNASYSEYLKQKSAWQGRFANTATSGYVTDSSAYGMISTNNYGVKIKAFTPDGYYSTRSLVLVLIGTNDLRIGTSVSTIMGNIRTLWANARSDGFRVIAFTIPPRNDTDWNSTKEAARLELNALIEGDSANWDALIKTHLILPNPDDTTLFQADKLHIASAGSQVLADAIAAQINPATV
jgi:lysophospholipase L1-like esterase